MTEQTDQLAAALAFKRERLLAATELVEPVGAMPGVLSLRCPSLPFVWELNLLFAPAGAAGRHPAELLAVCDEVQRDHGFAHRKLRLDGGGGGGGDGGGGGGGDGGGDGGGGGGGGGGRGGGGDGDWDGDGDRDGDGGGSPLESTARAAGWIVDRELVMVRRRGPDRPPPPGIAESVVELDRAALDHSADLFLRKEPHGHDPEVRRQLVAQYDRWEQAAPSARRPGIVEDGRVVAWCRVYDDGAVTEIDDVSVLHDRRGAGLGRRLMEGVIAAVPPGRLLFLLAAADDWPRELYARLGFDAVGERIGATREPAA